MPRHTPCNSLRQAAQHSGLSPLCSPHSKALSDFCLHRLESCPALSLTFPPPLTDGTSQACPLHPLQNPPPVQVRVCVRARACMCVPACVREGACACMRVRVCVYVCVWGGGGVVDASLTGPNPVQ